MRRRDLLGAVTASGALSLSGCTTGSLLSSSSPSHSEEIAIVEQDSVPQDFDITIQAEVTNATYSDEQPAQIEIVVENTGDREYIQIYSNENIQCQLFNKSEAKPENTRGLWLYPAGDAKLLSRQGDKWVEDRPQDESRQYAAYGCGIASYESGETFSQLYQVWHDYRADGYLNPGTYRWEDQVGVGNSERINNTFRWGFEIELKES